MDNETVYNAFFHHIQIKSNGYYHNQIKLNGYQAASMQYLIQYKMYKCCILCILHFTPFLPCSYFVFITLF